MQTASMGKCDTKFTDVVAYKLFYDFASRIQIKARSPKYAHMIVNTHTINNKQGLMDEILLIRKELFE